MLATLLVPTLTSAQKLHGWLEAGTADPGVAVAARIIGDGSDGSGLNELHELPLSDPPATNLLFNQPARAFAFANEQNRFYTGFVTGFGVVPRRDPRGVEGGIEVGYYSPVYVKTNPTPGPTTFTITPSYLELKAATRHLDARLDVVAYLCAVKRILFIDAQGNPLLCVEQARIVIAIGGHNDLDFDPATDNHTYRLNLEIVEGDGLSAGQFEVIRTGMSLEPEGARYDLPSQTGSFSLAFLTVGDSFYFRYTMKLRGTALEEGASRGFFGDPLEVDSGLTMQIGDGIELVDPQPQLSTQQCAPNMLRESPDDRFVALPNGTAHDLESGLQWPRCPQGYSLDEAGTADLADDRCVAAGTTEFTWQAALQEGVDAATRGDFGHTDWRVANAKELATLIETACAFPAMNTNIFPEAQTVGIWSSTPSDFDFSFSVDFLRGRLDTLSQVAAQNGVRLVRTEDDFRPPLDDDVFSDGFESAP